MITPKSYDEATYQEARDRFDGIAKPLDGLGVFEDMICRIAGMQGSADIDISKRIAVIMCSDNGIVDEGVTQSQSDVTAKVAMSMAKGRSSVCLMARGASVDTLPVDIGIKNLGELRSYKDVALGEDGHYRLLDRCIKRGTKDFSKEPAMTAEEFTGAFTAGRELAKDLAAMGYRIICTGEMGIGNTTTAAAITAALLKLPAGEVTGRGAGLSDEGYKKKIKVIEQAIDKYDLYAIPATDVAAKVGGLDIAALAGVYTGGAECGIPVVIDGLISAAAALLASRICPESVFYMLPSHKGGETGISRIMTELKLKPVIDAGMKLGEGTGAVMLMPLLDLTLSVYKGSAVFDDIKVNRYIRWDKGLCND